MNDGSGYYGLFDSIYFDHGFPVVHGNYFDNNEYIDLYSRHQIGATEYIAMIYNYGISQFDSLKIFYTNDDSAIDDFADGDVDNDNDNDVVFTCNNDLLWGIIYNDGTGNFSTPQYYDLSFPPVDITCADLNNDGRADIVVCGSDTEIYFSTETGFQQLVLTTTLSHDVLISDFDNDGDNDVITHTTFIYPNHRVYFFENLGNNQFFEHDYFQFSPFCSYAQIANLNKDSLPDIVFIASDHSGLHIYNNPGDFELEFQQFISYDNLTLGGLYCEDYDNNGYKDLTFISGFGQIEFYLNILFNDGEGNFQENPITKIIEKADNNIYIECSPNPMKHETNIKIKINETARVELAVYNVQGKPIIDLVNKKMEGGIYNIKWDGVDNSNHTCNPGPYFAYLAVNGKALQTIKLLKI
ncbi:MAG: FG-GAP-like repeat-containing protein [Bacteroidales bacterium]|nr:FG-GAP-like repeat-containing protein [Bacteroidales bacterium]MCF8403508.1 FG-GAP-like repeat-containing protein [Bacteroidales bacterium]